MNMGCTEGRIDDDAHVATCATCRSLRALEGATLPPAPRVPVAKVIRRAALVAGVFGVAAFALIRPEPSPAAEAPVIAEGPSLGELAPLQPAPSLESLALLHHTVAQYARVDPTTHGYGPRFGSLPQLLALSPAVSEESP